MIKQIGSEGHCTNRRAEALASFKVHEFLRRTAVGFL